MKNQQYESPVTILVATTPVKSMAERNAALADSVIPRVVAATVKRQKTAKRVRVRFLAFLGGDCLFYFTKP
jgi:hypothetical protein